MTGILAPVIRFAAAGCALGCVVLFALLLASPAEVAAQSSEDDIFPEEEQPENGEPRNFRRFRLKLNLELSDVYAIDLTGNGLRDLVVIETDRTTRKPKSSLLIFVQSEEGFTPLEAARRPLPQDLLLADVGHFSSGPGLVLLTSRRLFLWHWTGTKFDDGGRPGIAADTIFTRKPGSFKTGIRWILDLNEDGINEILLPALHGYTLVREGGNGELERLAVLNVHSDSRMIKFYRRLYVSHEVPEFRIVDIDGEGWLDLVVYNQGLLQIFYMDGIPNTQAREPDMVRDFQPPEVFDPKEPWDPPLLLMDAGDINLDGTLDLIFSKNSVGETALNASSSILVYYGSRDGKGGRLEYNKKPDQVYVTEGFTLPIIRDINSDGRKDLVLVNVEITFWNSIKALISRTVNADAAFYIMPPSGKYAREPSEMIEYSVKFSLGRFAHQPLTTFGDLNGDGLPDLLLSLDKSRIGIHWGRKNSYWSSDYDAVLEDYFPIRVRRIDVSDLNNDGRDDLIVKYDRKDIRLMPEMLKTVTVLLSKFPIPKRD